MSKIETISYVSAEELEIKLCEALGLAPGMTGRIVIDIQPTYPVMVYVQMVGSKALLDFDWQTFVAGGDVRIAERKGDESADQNH